jgi:hypothetical protein
LFKEKGIKQTGEKKEKEQQPTGDILAIKGEKRKLIDGKLHDIVRFALGRTSPLKTIWRFDETKQKKSASFPKSSNNIIKRNV